MIELNRKIDELSRLIADQQSGGGFACKLAAAIERGLIKREPYTSITVIAGCRVELHDSRLVVDHDAVQAYVNTINAESSNLEARMAKVAALIQKGLEMQRRANDEPFPLFIQGFMFGPQGQDYPATVDGWKELNLDWANFYYRKAKNEFTA